MPERSPEERFMELAAEAVDRLPEWVHEAMDNVEVFVEDLPPPDQPGLLGLYHGVPLSKRHLRVAGRAC
jgi:predicted Zn-dependent protease with MMP-like domain